MSFHLFAANFFSCPIDLLLGTTLNNQISRWGQLHQISGSVKSFGSEIFGILFGGSIVSANGIGTSDKQMAGFAHRNFAVGTINHPNLILGRNRSPLGIQDDLFWIVEARVAHQSFCHAEHLLQATTQGRCNLASHLRRKFGTTHLQNLQAR